MTSINNNDPPAPIEDDEIQAYSVLQWRTIGSMVQSQLRKTLDRREHINEFSDEYIRSVGERWRELQRINLRLSLVLLALIVFMGTIQFGGIQEFTIAGLRVASNNASLAILALIAAVLLFLTSLFSLMETYYERVLRALSADKVDEEFVSLYMLQFSWYGTPFLSGVWRNDGKQFASKAVLFLGLLLVTCVALFVFLLEVGQFYLFVSSLITIYQFPHLPLVVNSMILLLAGFSIAVSIIGWILKAPLPYIDYSNLDRLRKLEESDPGRASRIRSNIARHGLRRERRNTLVLQQIVMCAIMVILYLARYGGGFFFNLLFLWNLAVAVALFSLLVAPILDGVERTAILRLDKSGDMTFQVNQYIRRKRDIFLFRLLVALLSGSLLFFWFER